MYFTGDQNHVLIHFQSPQHDIYLKYRKKNTGTEVNICKNLGNINYWIEKHCVK